MLPFLIEDATSHPFKSEMSIEICSNCVFLFGLLLALIVVFGICTARISLMDGTLSHRNSIRANQEVSLQQLKRGLMVPECLNRATLGDRCVFLPFKERVLDVNSNAMSQLHQFTRSILCLNVTTMPDCHCVHLNLDCGPLCALYWKPPEVPQCTEIQW